MAHTRATQVALSPLLNAFTTDPLLQIREGVVTHSTSSNNQVGTITALITLANYQRFWYLDLCARGHSCSRWEEWEHLGSFVGKTKNYVVWGVTGAWSRLLDRFVVPPVAAAEQHMPITGEQIILLNFKYLKCNFLDWARERLRLYIFY